MADVTRSVLAMCGREESLLRKFADLYDRVSGRNALPRLVICFPAARMNKFQSQLYGQAPEFGYAVERISNISELDQIDWPGPIVFHVHWMNVLGQGAPERSEFEANIDNAIEKIEDLSRRTGAKKVWTAHNIAPHAPKFPDIAQRLREYVLHNFDLIHFLEPGHQALLEERYGKAVPAAFVARHPHYVTSYPSHLEVADARERIGFEPSSKVILFFGSIQRYKGIDDLIGAFKSAVAGGRSDLRLVIAGIASDREYVEELERLVEDDENILFAPFKVADENVQLFFKAADYTVLPYSGEQLNSGAALLSLSFDTPILAPDLPAFRALERFGVRLYERDESGLEDAIEGLGREPIACDFAAFRSHYDPVESSREFFRGLETLFV